MKKNLEYCLVCGVTLEVYFFWLSNFGVRKKMRMDPFDTVMKKKCIDHFAQLPFNVALYFVRPNMNLSCMLHVTHGNKYCNSVSV